MQNQSSSAISFRRSEIVERDMANLSKTVNERCSLQVFLLTKLDESCFKINKTSGNIQ